jgi:hypothetical protein
MFNNQSFIFNINTDLQDSQSYKLYSNLKKHLQFYTDVLGDFINNYNIIKATNTVYKQKKYKKSVAEANAEEVEPEEKEEAAIEEEAEEPAPEIEEIEEEEEPEKEAIEEEAPIIEEPVIEEPVEAEEQLDVAFPNKTKKYKRCPNGERRNKVTKKCEPNKK